ncbi:hypothetical protein MNR01_13235 [Lysobacter sp. S4-A87]|uniref:hypothetical protein n=1 Tax=Lysobacter sp. S4-A87 TaxID=2925843 RepID=UPI001F53CDF2|nr:hypothetical protein [Lysobacter sp. S4-A87]UNK48700.1 hypothetical protein MNR01_13235 [Lysobacter sp. S4-A87]
MVVIMVVIMAINMVMVMVVVVVMAPDTGRGVFDFVELPSRYQDWLRRQPQQKQRHEAGTQNGHELSGTWKHGRRSSCSTCTNATEPAGRPSPDEGSAPPTILTATTGPRFSTPDNAMPVTTSDSFLGPHQSVCGE